jgi:hypothetical protein
MVMGLDDPEARCFWQCDGYSVARAGILDAFRLCLGETSLYCSRSRSRPQATELACDEIMKKMDHFSSS